MPESDHLQLLHKLLQQQLVFCQAGNFDKALEIFTSIEDCLKQGDAQANLPEKKNSQEKAIWLELKKQCELTNQNVLKHLEMQKQTIAKEYLSYEVDQELARLNTNHI